MWWWQFEWSEEGTPDSITKFAWLVKIRSIYGDESPIKCVGSLIIYFNPNWEVTPSILEPSYLVMSILYQRLVFTLKSARTTVKKGLFTITDSWFNSKLLINDSKISWDWLGEWYNTMKLHSLILFLFQKNNFYFKMNAFLQVIDIFSFNWKGNIVVNTPCVTFKEWSSLYRL